MCFCQDKNAKQNVVDLLGPESLIRGSTIACASAKAMATRGRLCNDFSPLQTFDKLNLCIRHLKTKLVVWGWVILFIPLIGYVYLDFIHKSFFFQKIISKLNVIIK